MKQNIVEWLPPEALAHPRFSSDLGAALEGWNERWTGSGGRYKPMESKPARNNVRAFNTLEWRRFDNGLSCSWTEDLGTRLGLILVDADGTTFSKTACDKMLLGSLAFEALADLTDLVHKTLRLDAASFTGDLEYCSHVEWHLRDTKKTLPDLILRIPSPMLASARKNMIGSRFTPPTSNGSLATACADASLSVRALLGEATIGWGDLKKLETGDVVVLGKAMSEEFTLISSKGGHTICGLKLVQQQDSLELRAAGLN